MKFLNIDGLSHFLDKTKTWIGNNYYEKKDRVTIKEGEINIANSNKTITTFIDGVSFSVFDKSTSDSARVASNIIRVFNTKKPTVVTDICSDHIISSKFVKNNGTKTQVLLADGSVATLNVAGGIPTLNPEGKIDANKVAIDTTLFEIVTELPSTKETIIKNRIYLKASTETDPSGKNIYSEYIYTGDLSTDYDETKWEKLGEYKSEVDLSGYAKNEKVITGFTVNKTDEVITITGMAGSKFISDFDLPCATSQTIGLMSSSNYSKLESIADSATADEALNNNDIDTLFA